MQELTRELHIIRQAHKEEMEAQRQGFQIQLEQVGGKVEQLELRLENEVRALRSSGQQAAQNPPPLAKAVVVSSSGTQDERAEKQTEDRRSEEESQKHRQARTQMTQTSPGKTNCQLAPPVKVTYRWLPRALPKLLQKMLGRKLLVVVENKKRIHRQRSSQKKEG